MPGPYPLSGRGVQTIAQPSQIVATVTHIGTNVGLGRANPQNYQNLGLLSWGDANGYRAPQPLVTSPQVFDLPPGMTRLGYALLGGSTVSVAEVAAPVAVPSAIWDRNPTPVGASALVGNPSGIADSIAWTYTVPAGRKLWLASARVQHSRLSASTPAGLGTATASIVLSTGQTLALAYLGDTQNTVFDELDSGLVLVATHALTAHYSNNSTGAWVYTTLQFAGTLFDA